MPQTHRYMQLRKVFRKQSEFKKMYESNLMLRLWKLPRFVERKAARLLPETIGSVHDR